MEHHVLFSLSATDDVRLFAFVRFTTGDAMSKRSKFALITWIGENVSGLQRAKTGTDKTLVKEVVQVLSSSRVWRSQLTKGYHPARRERAGLDSWVCSLAVTWDKPCCVSAPVKPLVKCHQNCFRMRARRR